jgi:hypothetical protein
VTAESAESQAVRDTLLNSLGYHVEALDEFDHMLGLHSKQQIKRSQKRPNVRTARPSAVIAASVPWDRLDSPR